MNALQPEKIDIVTETEYSYEDEAMLANLIFAGGA